MSAPVAKCGLRSLSKRVGLSLSRQYVSHPSKIISATLVKLNCKSPPVVSCYNPLQQQQVRWAGLLNVSLTSTYVDLSEEELYKAKEYLRSSDYEERYRDKPVWADYKRNFKGQLPPEKTRKQCIRGKGETKKVCSNPCPICRDESLLIDYRNIQLLEQFICPHSWEIYSYMVTGVCQRMHKQLVDAIHKSRQYGLLPYQPQHIHYDYDDYYRKEQPSDR